MASRVNTKFVVILIVAVVAMLGMLFAAYSVVYKTAGDLAARGDQFVAEGNYDAARKAYSRAVNKDPTIVENLEKWIDALEHWIPETETAYYDAFRSNYLGAIHQAAVVQRTNIEAYERELGLQYTMLLQQYSRGQADGLITRTTDALGFFDGNPGVDPAWPALRRFRAMAWERIGANGGIVDQDVYEMVGEDFRASMEAAPDNEEILSFYMRWLIYEASHIEGGSDAERLQTARDTALSLAESFLQRNPTASSVLVTRLAIQMENARAEVSDENSEQTAERTQAIYDSFADFKEPTSDLYNKLISLPSKDINIRAVYNFNLIEMLVDPNGSLDQSIALFNHLLKSRPDSSTIMLSLAELYATRGRLDEGMALYQSIVDHPLIPISLDGVNLFNSKRSSSIAMASIYLDNFQELAASQNPDQSELDSILAKAIASRDRYADTVAEDNSTLMLLDGRIAYAKNDTEEALRLFKSYNGQQTNPNIRGLWYEAVAAQDLNQLGTAKLALEKMLEAQKSNVPALLRLADVETRLQNFSAAKLHYQAALVYQPDNRLARESIAKINALQDPSLIDDPAQALLVRAQQLKRGNDENTGDISAAITVLSNGIESVNYAPRITQELASMLVDQGDLVGARALIAKAVAANPDDEYMKIMRDALANDDEVSILIAMIKSSKLDEIDQQLSIANVAMRRDRPELFVETLNHLLEIAPDDNRVLELAFIRALNSDDMESANEIAAKAQKSNADGVNGLSFQARIAADSGDHARAVQILEQITSSGSADSMFHRMLAMEYQQVGRMDAAVDSFEQALSIRPDDQQSIIDYLRAQMRAGHYEEALDIARRFQRYANDSPQFISMWLSLESSYGNEAGKSFAIKQREKFLELDPKNEANKFALASLYVDTGKWAEGRVLIDELKAEEDKLEYINLEANWYANQGRVGNLNGLAAARQVFLDYIERHEDENEALPYIVLSRFMLDRGRPDLAIQAASSAVEREDPGTLDGTKLQGDLFIILNQYSNAADAFKKVVDNGADIQDQYRLRLIDMLIRIRQFDEARIQFDLVDPSRKTSVVAMLQNSEIEEGLGNLDMAADLLDQAVAKYSDDPMVYVKRAEFNAGTEDNMNDVLADVDAALQIDPNDWRAYRIRAAAYFAIDERDSALLDLQKAVRLNPTLDQALFGIINEFMIDGKNAEAYDFALEIIQSRQRDASLANSLGQLFSSRGDWDRAAKFYQLAWEIQRSPTAGATLIDALVRMRNPDTALANSVINDLTQIAGDINTSPGLLAAQALVLQARGREELAIQQLTKAFDLSSNDDENLLLWSSNISRFFEDQPMQDQIAYIESLKRRNPNKEVLNWLDLFIAQRLMSVNSQLDGAFGVLERLAKVSSQPRIQQIALMTYGSAMFSRGDYERAVEFWTKGVELFPNDWEMNNNLAYVLSVEMGQHERALELARASIEANPNRSEPYDTIGKILIELKQFDEAQRMLSTGMKYALSVRSRVTLVIAQIELDLARGRIGEAKAKLIEIRSLMRAMPTRDASLEADADAIEDKINSLG